MDPIFERAAEFLLTHARLLERRIFAHTHRGGPAQAVAEVLRGYVNPDGGFGSALEPDLRTSESQPIFVEVGLQALAEVGHRDRPLAERLCGFLESVADASGLVPAALPGALESPRAGHWNGPFALDPSLNPTLGICGLLHFQGVHSAWLDRATRTCVDSLRKEIPKEAHTLLGATHFLDQVPDPPAIDGLFERVAEAIPTANFFILEAPVDRYGLTPLHFATHPESRWSSLFSEDCLRAHLDDLRSKQQEDGGWPISWTPPGPAAELEWRGRITLDALRVLASFGVLERPPRSF